MTSHLVPAFTSQTQFIFELDGEYLDAMISQFLFILFIIVAPSFSREKCFKYSPPTKDASIKKFSPGSSTPIDWSQVNDALMG